MPLATCGSTSGGQVLNEDQGRGGKGISVKTLCCLNKVVIRWLLQTGGNIA